MADRLTLSELGYSTSLIRGELELAPPVMKHFVTDSVTPSNITAGEIFEGIEIVRDGNLRSGKTDYNTGTGFWLGADSGTTKFSIGREEALFSYDGETLALTGDNSTSPIMEITGDNLQIGGTLLKLSSDSGDAFNRNLLEIINDNTAAWGSRGIKIQQDAAAPCLDIDLNANSKAIAITAETTTDDTFSCISTSLTTGSCAVFSDGSTSTGVRNGVEILNISSLATGVTPLLISQAAVTSTNFKKIMTIAGFTIWTSDGTTAEANLTGTEGDICLNGGTGAGQTAYCDANGSNWTDM